MFSLKKIKDRIKSIQSTCKITQAMKLVAQSRYSKLYSRLSFIDNYTSSLLSIFQKLYIINRQNFIKHSNALHSIKNAELIVIFSSDKGLCGAFNNKIFNILENNILTRKRHKTHYKLACYGEKITQYVKKHHKQQFFMGKPCIANKQHFLNLYNISYKLAYELFLEIKTREFSSCEFIYTHYSPSFYTQVLTKKILPITPSQIPLNNSSNQIYTLDNPTQKIYKVVTKNLFFAYFYKFYLNSIISEYYTRMVAMDYATNNADDLLTNLQTQYNRQRQKCITKELMEITSGAMITNE